MVETSPAVSLRPWTNEDESYLAEWFKHAEVPQYLVPRLKGLNLLQIDPQAWIPREESSRLYAVLAEEQGPRPIGIGSLHSPCGDTVELGLIIGEPSIWGRGYGRTATLALAAIAFENNRCGRVVARVQPDNKRAQGCFRAVGFESREGREHEPVWLTLTRTAWAMRMRELAAESHG